MALYRLAIFKRLTPAPDTVWQNVYHVDAADETEALQMGDQIITIERTIHSEEVQFWKQTARLASALAPSGRQSLYSGVVGDRTVTPAARLPLFNAVRCIFGDDTGRSEQKYLRLPLYEGDVAGGFIEEAFITTINTSYLNALNDLTFLRGPQGEPLLTFRVQDAIQNRQLGWHRRTRRALSAAGCQSRQEY